MTPSTANTASAAGAAHNAAVTAATAVTAVTAVNRRVTNEGVFTRAAITACAPGCPKATGAALSASAADPPRFRFGQPAVAAGTTGTTNTTGATNTTVATYRKAGVGAGRTAGTAGSPGGTDAAGTAGPAGAPGHTARGIDIAAVAADAASLPWRGAG
jgi:hypothetical protein